MMLRSANIHPALPLRTDRGVPVDPVEFSNRIGASSDADEILLAILEFQRWLLDLRRQNLLTNPNDKMIAHVGESITRRFCIGSASNRIFMGVGVQEMSWFRHLPWLHVALCKGSNRINLVVAETTVQGITTPYFALSLEAGSPERIRELSKFHYLDIREVEISEAGSISVSRNLQRTIDVVIVQDESTIQNLVADKVGKTYSQRSKFSKVR